MKPVVFLTGLLLLLSSCGKEDSLPIVRDGNQLSYGLDSLVFTDWNHGPGAIKVYYYIPISGNVRTMKILFAMHGADRNGLYQVQNWMETADDKNLIVVSPQLDRDDFPPLAYQFGGVSASEYSFEETPRETWTYTLVEEIFSYIRRMTGNTSSTYDLWGHSAGAQFTHRMALFMDDSCIGRAVCSNAGFYTAPVPEGISDSSGKIYGYPYSVKDTNLDDNALRRYFAMDLVVHLGTADLATSKEEDSSLPVDAGSKVQGASRYERGRYFYEKAMETAESKGFAFNWRLIEVPGVAHNSRLMIQSGTTGAAAVLYYNE